MEPPALSAPCRRYSGEQREKSQRRPVVNPYDQGITHCLLQRVPKRQLPAEQSGRPECQIGTPIRRSHERPQTVEGLDCDETDEAVEAELVDGVLCVTLTKKPEAQPHRITIGGNGNANKGSRNRLARETAE